MYLPSHFTETRLEVLHALMQAHPLGLLVSSGAAGPEVNPIPMLLDTAQEPYGVLRMHVARANPIWQTLAMTNHDVIAVFQGAESYISPSWYPSKQAHGKVVPTWNYAMVQAYGTPRVIEDTDWLHELVSALTAQHEAGQETPWQVSDAPVDFTHTMLQAIVGIELPISRIEGKWKVSQNRSATDRAGVAAGLRQNQRDPIMAALVDSSSQKS
jgi:transcriptional regulator